MNWFQADQPLGLPPGSVRAVLALGLVGAVIGAYFVFGAVPKELLALAGPIIGAYFGVRATSNGPG